MLTPWPIGTRPYRIGRYAAIAADGQVAQNAHTCHFNMARYVPLSVEGVKMAQLLIVDDELDVREFAANFFRKRKIQVSTAASGQEALEKIEQELPRLVLLDIMMPGLDGVQTLESIRQKNKDLKVIMVTGKKPQEDQAFDKCRALGALEYIHKPLELEELERIVLKELK